MRRIGVTLIFLAVALRTIPKFADNTTFGLVLAYLAAYGFLMFLQEWKAPGQEIHPSRAFHLSMAGYLVTQLALVNLLLSTEPREDYALLLLLPLAMQAVFAFGWEIGRIWIVVIGLSTLVPMVLFSDEKVLGLVMSTFYTGLSLSLGGFAHQTQKANRIKNQNQELLAELSAANEQLKGYAGQREALAAEQERTRLARDLHDSVTQTVFSMNLTVQSTRMMLEKETPRAAGQLDRLQELSRGALGEIQRLVNELQQPGGDSGDLKQALRHLVDERQRRDGLIIDLETIGESQMTGAVADGLLRIVSEALTNIVKHAGVREASLTLDLQSSPAYLEIEDNGAGFNDQDRVKQGHMGLLSMTERAEEIGWKLTIHSSPRQGTCIRLEEGRGEPL